MLQCCIGGRYVHSIIMSTPSPTQRWHTLEWFRQDGRYATHWSRQQGCEAYAQFLREHVTSVATNYKDFVYAYDVFNEVCTG